MFIYIDPGHGGEDSGAQIHNPFYYNEKEFNLSLSEKLRNVLESQEHTVRLTRESDINVSLLHRAQMANFANADIFVSVHANGASIPSINGMETYHYPGSSNGKSLANLILNSMHDDFPDHEIRGVKSANFTVLRLTIMPAVLVECEFITNAMQAAFLKDQANQQLLADAIARGIQIYF